MKKYLTISFAILLAAFSVSCTQNQRARSFGGTATVELPKGTKLVGATWKEEHLWYLTRPMREDEQPETSTLQESSSFGLVQGTVIFHESK